MNIAFDNGLEGKALWRRQNARNLMDCYSLAMEAASESWEKSNVGNKPFDSLVRLMVDGMTAVRGAEDEKGFYRMAAASCREGGVASEERGAKEKARLFRIYAAIFEEMGQ